MFVLQEGGEISSRVYREELDRGGGEGKRFVSARTGNVVDGKARRGFEYKGGRKEGGGFLERWRDFVDRRGSDLVERRGMDFGKNFGVHFLRCLMSGCRVEWFRRTVKKKLAHPPPRQIHRFLHG